MKRFKYYKPLIGAIILAGVMIMMALRISDIANGDTKPVATNSTAAGKAENRRVDVYIHR